MQMAAPERAVELGETATGVDKAGVSAEVVARQVIGGADPMIGTHGPKIEITQPRGDRSGAGDCAVEH